MLIRRATHRARSPLKSDADAADQEQCAVIRSLEPESTCVRRDVHRLSEAVASSGQAATHGHDERRQRLTYEIRVRGELTDALVAALQALNLHIEQTENGTILIGVFRDQAELHGALRDMQDSVSSWWKSDKDDAGRGAGTL